MVYALNAPVVAWVFAVQPLKSHQLIPRWHVSRHLNKVTVESELLAGRLIEDAWKSVFQYLELLNHRNEKGVKILGLPWHYSEAKLIFKHEPQCQVKVEIHDQKWPNSRFLLRISEKLHPVRRKEKRKVSFIIEHVLFLERLIMLPMPPICGGIVFLVILKPLTVVFKFQSPFCIAVLQTKTVSERKIIPAPIGYTIFLVMIMFAYWASREFSIAAGEEEASMESHVILFMLYTGYPCQ
jgi:hypothetical protein